MAEIERALELFLYLLLLFTCINAEKHFTKRSYLHVANSVSGDFHGSGPKLFELNEDKSDFVHFEDDKLPNRVKRSLGSTKNITSKITRLNDSHQQILVHWIGPGSDVIVCLTKNGKRMSSEGRSVPSAVYFSYDYGDTFENKTEHFALDDEKRAYARLDQFMAHPKFTDHVIFSDSENKVIFTTKDSGKTIQRVKLPFHPSSYAFHNEDPYTFVVHDKINSTLQLWLTRDFGETWRPIQESVKKFAWSGSTIPSTPSHIPNVMPMDGYEYKNDSELLLFVERIEPSGKSTVISSASLFLDPSDYRVWIRDVNELDLKDDFMFAVKVSGKNNVDLYVSYKRGPFVKAVFPSELDRQDYHIPDVSEGQIFVAVSHTDTVANLYASQSMDKKNIYFSLSLERILCFFPNSTWMDSWIMEATEEPFADFHKVEGLRGIYIASQVQPEADSNNITPEHLLTLITFDRGGEWRPLTPPPLDESGLPTNCTLSQGCSLHLSQKFSQLYPHTRSIPIFSSKSAPGIIMAMGTIGKSLKGHPAVFLSRDGGLTWHQILKNYYLFTFGDHGGILVAVKFFRSQGKSREILYSTDEGERFLSHEFHAEELRIYGLMAKPGGDTTTFTMFGSAMGHHQWLIIKVDLRNAFSYNCTADDYKFWSPGSKSGVKMSCILGRKETYARRIPHSNCYNGKDYQRPIRIEVCDCDAEDFDCDFGFRRSISDRHCISNKSLHYHPYEIPATCAPGGFYNRTRGYIKIPGDVCEGGREYMYLPEVLPCPIKETKEFLIVAQRKKITRVDLTDNTAVELPVSNLRNVIAIEFDLKNNCVYWADIASAVIARQCLTGNDSKPEILLSHNISSIEGMALDWVSKNLYFVDGVKQKIEVIRIDIKIQGRMRRIILDEKYVQKPRGIAVHPMEGYMFWTDWAMNDSFVSRANLDGTDVRRLFRKPDVLWPNGITIDYIAQRIYWVDAKLDYIASANLDGKQFKKIMQNDERVIHPFAVAVFKDNMYWDDWKLNSTFVADKDHGVNVSVILRNHGGLMDLKVFAHSFQEGTNACGNSSLNKCSHLCMGGPGNTHTCLCPENMILDQGVCYCPGRKEPDANGACPSVGLTCAPDSFMCANSFCIPNAWVCNDANDCGDDSDEINCNKSNCSNNFACSDGVCIPANWRCDYDEDCKDGSDEKNCPYSNITCAPTEYKCKNGRCIDSHLLCDGQDDCYDESDEEFCKNKPSDLVCEDGHFKCGSICVAESWMCDGEDDCPNREDEENCKVTTCGPWQFQCNNKMCIFEDWKCDGERDCDDGADEINCPPRKDTPTHTQTESVPRSCDGWNFKCRNKTCIPLWWKCDGSDDCGDNSDELGCPTNTSYSPISPDLEHDFCQPDEFRCQSGKCISQSLVCDGVDNCGKYEDETNCKGPAGPSCSNGYFSCDASLCIPLTQLCDGVENCYDGSDENNCASIVRVYQILHMEVERKKSNSSSLLIYWQVPPAQNLKLQYLPSIVEADKSPWSWQNTTWIDSSEYRFTNLKPYTKYNMTVYVRIANTSQVFPPVKFITGWTSEGVPSPPRNLSVVPKSYRSVELSWLPPLYPNGKITSYVVDVSPPNPSVVKAVTGSVTKTTYEFDFVENQNYTFRVCALNSDFESDFSETVTFTISPSFYIEPVRGLKAEQVDEKSIRLTWRELPNVDGYHIQTSCLNDIPYPKVPSVNATKDMNSIIITNLAPSVRYLFKVNAFRDGMRGPPAVVKGMIQSPSLPVVNISNAELVKGEGTTVKLTWTPPQNAPKQKWVYGIYYSVRVEELLEGAKVTTSNLSISIRDLAACETYLFVVGLVGPIGVGPLSAPFTLTTSYNKNAPPKNLFVRTNPSDERKMVVRWESSCKIVTEPIGFEVIVTELNLNKSSSVTLSSSTKTSLQHIFNTHYGGRYKITVSTTAPKAIPTLPVYYDAPEILPPHQVQALSQTDGSRVLIWRESPLPKAIQDSGYKYKILISEGGNFNVSTAKEYFTDSTRFTLSEVKEGVIYSFAVMVVTDDGYSSRMSEITSFETPSAVGEFFPSTNFVSILVPIMVLLIALLIVLLGFFVYRQKRLKRHFSNYANSHYDTRSGSTTFGGADDLEDEDSPNIRGFSDDEPLVMA